MSEITISQAINLKIGEDLIVLSEKEAKELRDELNRMFPPAQINRPTRNPIDDFSPFRPLKEPYREPITWPDNFPTSPGYPGKLPWGPPEIWCGTSASLRDAPGDQDFSKGTYL